MDARLEDDRSMGYTKKVPVLSRVFFSEIKSKLTIEVQCGSRVYASIVGTQNKITHGESSKQIELIRNSKSQDHHVLHNSQTC